MSRLAMIPLEKIRTNPVALRDVNKKSEAFQQLVDSVKLKGVLSPISVRPKTKTGDEDDGKEFELIDGLQRFTASTEVGSGVLGEVGVIPAHILDQSDEEALVSQIIANSQRIETKPVEYARAMMRLLALNPTWTESQLAASLAKSPSWIGKQLGLLKLHEAIKPLVDEGKIVVANAYALAKLPQEEQMNWLERAQTMNSNEFAPAALARVKEIRDANKTGSDAAPESFIPTAHLRKKTEIESILNGGDSASLVEELLATVDVADPVSAKRGFELGLQWALNLDSKSVAAAKERYEADQKQREEDKARRDAEKKQKRAQELAEKSDAAQKEAAAAREKAGV